MGNKKISIQKTIIFLIIMIYAFISLYPLIWVVIQSFKTEREFLQSIWTLPSSLNFSNYQTALVKGKLGRSFLNSVINVSSTLVVELTFTILAGYAFSKLYLKFKNIFWGLILLNMLIPTPIILLPMYLQVTRMHIQNTLIAIIFPYFQGFAPLGLVLITNYFNLIPDEILEASKIEGCGILRTLISLIIPMSKPILATLAILGGMSAWNEYMWALTSISKSSRYPLSVGITIIRDQSSIYGYTPVFAALTLSAILFVILFLASQKTFVKSITAGAVKG